MMDLISSSPSRNPLFLFRLILSFDSPSHNKLSSTSSTLALSDMFNVFFCCAERLAGMKLCSIGLYDGAVHIWRTPLFIISPQRRKNVEGSFDHRRKEMHHDGVSLFGQFLYSYGSVYTIEGSNHNRNKCCCPVPGKMLLMQRAFYTPDLIHATRECCCCNSCCSCWPAYTLSPFLAI